MFKSTANYFASESGRIVTQWPFSATRFWWIGWALRRRDMLFRQTRFRLTQFRPFPEQGCAITVWDRTAEPTAALGP